jgi:predicted nucleotidyltransferase
LIFGRLDALTRQLEEILGCRVDIVAEPIRREALRRSIETEAVSAF